jgi:16S rRNA C1402 (ribose-2'-O) methylase RsmI
MKKYMFLIIPGIAAAVTSVLVISVPSTRYFVESYLPTYGESTSQRDWR